jgi:hypothetical protein
MTTTLQKQLAQIDYDAQKAKEALEADAYAARQKFADEESKRVRLEAEEMVKQIQYDAKK